MVCHVLRAKKAVRQRLTDKKQSMPPGVAMTPLMPFRRAVGPMLGLLMSLSLVFPLAMLVRGLVEEREKRLKETMCIMGLQAHAPP